jgi:hypothetical protein
MNFSKKMSFLPLVLTFTIVLGACGGAAPSSPTPTPTKAPPPATPTTDAVEAAEVADCEDPFAGAQVNFNPSYWDSTNFCLHSVEYGEIYGALPPDGIPAIDDPQFESVGNADSWLSEQSPVMIFTNEGEVRAYPLAILMWHEIVNDVVGGEPVAVTFCPLCNSTIVFERTLPDGRVVDFGTSGNLRNSDLVMYDRQTESWWQQITGEAIVGELTGTKLEFLPSQIVAWGDFKEEYPESEVLSRDTGYRRDYGLNPYRGYDDLDTSSMFPVSRTDNRLPPKERVAAVEIDGESVAYPFSELEQERVVNDEVAGTPLAVFWKAGAVSALDSPNIDSSQNVGSIAVYQRIVDGQVLEFTPTEQGFEDLQTGSSWTVFGEAVAGPLEGAELTPVVSGEHFWFAWVAFKPDTEVWSPEA